MNLKTIKEFVVTQRCLPWRVSNWLNCHAHPLYMLIMHSRVNINTRKYWDARWRSKDYGLSKERLSLFKQVASKIADNAFVLDVGCGDGSFIGFLREVRSVRALGIDFSFAAIECVRKRHVWGIVSLAAPVPFKAETFDVVTILEVLEHLDEKCLAATLDEARRVCKRSGMIVVSAPTTFPAGTPQCNPEHVRVFTKDEMRGLLSEYIADVTVEDSESGHYWVAYGYKR